MARQYCARHDRWYVEAVCIDCEDENFAALMGMTLPNQCSQCDVLCPGDDYLCGQCREAKTLYYEVLAR